MLFSLGRRMNAKLRELLAKSDDELFSKGGCHIYALALQRCYPKLNIKRAGHPQATDSLKAQHVYTVIDEIKVDVFGQESEEQYLSKNCDGHWDVSAEELTMVDPSKRSANGPLNQWRQYLD